MKSIIIGAGSDLGVHIDGAHLGPTQLINDLQSFNNSEMLLFMQDESIIKSRNLSDRRKNEYDLNNFNSKVYKVICNKIKEGYFPITIGGDHSISIASSLASSKEKLDIGLIFIDCQTCCNSFDTTINGNLEELVIPTVNGYRNKELRTFHDGNIIQTSKTVIIAAREINKWEKDNVKYSGITVFTIEDIKDKGIDKVLEDAFKIAGNKTEGIHVSCSIDAIDPEYAPGVSVQEDDGLTLEEALKVNEYIEKNIDKVVSYDIVNYNPLKDTNRKTEQIAVNLLAQVLKIVEKKDKYD